MGKIIAAGFLTIENLTLGLPEEISPFSPASKYSANSLLQIPLSILERANINLAEIVKKFGEKISFSTISNVDMVSFKGPVEVYLPAGKDVLRSAQGLMATALTACIALAVFIVLDSALKAWNKNYKVNRQPLCHLISFLIAAPFGWMMASHAVQGSLGQGYVRFS
jgi:hypothetical protein